MYCVNAIKARGPRTSFPFWTPYTISPLTCTVTGPPRMVQTPAESATGLGRPAACDSRSCWLSRSLLPSTLPLFYFESIAESAFLALFLCARHSRGLFLWNHPPSISRYHLETHAPGFRIHSYSPMAVAFPKSSDLLTELEGLTKEIVNLQTAPFHLQPSVSTLCCLATRIPHPEIQDLETLKIPLNQVETFATLSKWTSLTSCMFRLSPCAVRIR